MTKKKTSPLKTADLYSQIETLTKPRDESAGRNTSEIFEHVVEDAEGNTITAKKTKRSRRKTEPDFIKVYIADLARLFGCQPRVLTALARRMEFDSNIVALTPRIRQIVAKECGFSNTRSLKNALSKLSSKGLIKKIGHSEYMIDPRILAKGTWEKIEHAREIYDGIESADCDPVKVRTDLDAHFEFGQDKKADQETRDEFRAQCKLNEQLARDPYHIPFD